jgi:hypothetical protein
MIIEMIIEKRKRWPGEGREWQRKEEVWPGGFVERGGRGGDRELEVPGR